jgi:HEAT repeat protein
MLIVSLLVCLFQADDAPSLVEKLRSEKPEERTAAALKLKELGRAAVPALERASREPDLELAEQAKYLLKVIPLREKLTPEIFHVLPQLEERLVRGEWTGALMDAFRPGKNGQPIHHGLKKKDLEVLVGPVVAAEKDQYLRQVAIRLVGDLQLRAVLPTVAGLLGDPDPALRAVALAVIGQLRAREYTPTVRSMLQDRDHKVATQAVEALKLLEGKEAVPDFTLLLADFRMEVRGSAMRALQELGAKGSAHAIAALLKDPDLYLRASAAMILGEFGATDEIPRVAPLVHDGDPEVRKAALWALGTLAAKESIPEMVKLLDDPDGGARGRAAEALSRLNVREKKLVALLEDSDDLVRFQAAWSLGELGMGEAVPELRKQLAAGQTAGAGAANALGRLGAVEAIPDLVALVQRELNPGVATSRWMAVAALGELGEAAELRKLLGDPEPLVRWAAAQGLGRLGEDAEFAKLLEDANLSVRFWAGLALARRGQADGVPAVIEAAPKVQGGYLLWLNRLRAPEAWKHLEETKLDEAIGGSAEEVLEKLATKAGLKLEVGLALHKYPFRPNYLIPGGTSLARALDRAQSWMCSEFIMNSAPTRVRFELLLEPDKLRVVSRKSAHEIWKWWLEDRRQKK